MGVFVGRADDLLRKRDRVVSWFKRNQPPMQTTVTPVNAVDSTAVNGTATPAPQALAPVDPKLARYQHEQWKAQFQAEQEGKRRDAEEQRRQARQAEQAQRRQKRRDALQHGASRVRVAWRDYREKKRKQRFASDEFQVELDHFDGLEQAKLWFARAALFLGAFVLMVVAAWSVGFFFAGLHDFTTQDQEVFFSYLGSFALEGIFTGLMFTAALQKLRGRKWLGPFIGAILLAGVSMLAQYSSYETQFALGRIQTSDSAIESIPLLTFLIGSMKGHSFLFLLRGGAFHIAEAWACLSMPQSHKTADEQIENMRTIQQARINFEQARLFMDWMAEAHRQAHTNLLGNARPQRFIEAEGTGRQTQENAEAAEEPAFAREDARQVSQEVARPNSYQESRRREVREPVQAEQPDRLQLTIEALTDNPNVSDEELADYLSLKKPASARYWRLKALELLSSYQPAPQPLRSDEEQRPRTRRETLTDLIRVAEELKDSVGLDLMGLVRQELGKSGASEQESDAPLARPVEETGKGPVKEYSIPIPGVQEPGTNHHQQDMAGVYERMGSEGGEGSDDDTSFQGLIN